MTLFVYTEHVYISGKEFSINKSSRSHKYRATDILISLCATTDAEFHVKKHLEQYDVHFEVKITCSLYRS